MEWVTNYEIWAAFFSLLALEVVLGIDNIVFISVVVERLPPAQRKSARFVGLSLAMIMRILLLLSIGWIMSLTQPLFTMFDNAISWRDIILIVGGGFLLFKSVREMHNSLEDVSEGGPKISSATYMGVMLQIVLVDVVFSLDSVITAVGLVDEVPIMVAAIVCAVLIMMLAATTVSEFVERNPSIKMLALAFLVVIGVMLVAEGFAFHVPKDYIYSALAFSLLVEALNITFSRRKNTTLRKAQFADLFPSYQGDKNSK